MSLDTHSDPGLDDDNEGMEVDNDTANGDFPDISNSNISDFDVEYQVSNAPSSPHSWLNIGTSPPSPPPFPFQLSDGDVLQNEEVFADLTTEDYLEHDRCYTAYSRAEFDEMSAYARQPVFVPIANPDFPLTFASIRDIVAPLVGGTTRESTVAIRDNTFVREYRPATQGAGHVFGDQVRAIGLILALTLPQDPRFGIEEPQLHILAHITEAKDVEGDARTERASYTQLGRSFVLDITMIQRVVGRVETRGEKATGEWIIIDCNDELCPATFHTEEAARED
ncbi:hypothetical protein FRC09_013444 [Ceratobasidium sp. 395]|nr:hypothetical protein FRC09_013444 [Ceratobasidium sp. 395]